MFRASLVTKSNQPNLQVTESDAQNLQVTKSGLQISPMTRTLYLWTECGAARHAKMLSDDKAWDVFELLRESYFSGNDSASAPHSQPQEEGGSAEKFKIPAPVEYSNQLVLLTAQLAEYYKCSVENIRDNFRKNRDRFVVGKHYFKLEGDTLKAFRDEAENFRVAPRYQMSSLFLWTKRGAARHAKMLSTDKAWEVFEALEDNYFDRPAIVEEKPKAKSQPAPHPRRRAAQLRDSHVYAFLMSDNTVKIGIAGDVEKRMPQIERQYKLTVMNWHYSPLMTRKDALKLEAMCQKIFSPYRTEGEFFSVNFRSACALIDSYSKIIDERSDLNRAEKLLDIVDMMIDSLEKQKLLISSGKLIAGEKFF